MQTDLIPNPTLSLLREYSHHPILKSIREFQEIEDRAFLQGQKVLPVLQFTLSIQKSIKIKDFTVSLGAPSSGRSLASTNSYTWRHYEIQASHNIIEGKTPHLNTDGLEKVEEFREGQILSLNNGTLLFVPSTEIQLTVSKSNHENFTLKAELQIEGGTHIMAKCDLKIISPFIVKYASLQNLSRSPHCPVSAQEVFADSLLRVCLRNNSNKVINLRDIEFLLNSSIYSPPDEVQNFSLTVGSSFVQNFFHKCYRICLLPTYQAELIIPGEQFTYAMLIKRVEPLPPQFRQSILLKKQGRKSAQSAGDQSLNLSSLTPEEEGTNEALILKIINSQFAGSFSTPMLFLYQVDGIRSFMTQEILIRWHLLNSKALEIETEKLLSEENKEVSEIKVKLTVKSNLNLKVQPRFTFLNIKERTYIPDLLSFRFHEVVAQGQASRVLTFKKRRKPSSEPMCRLLGKIEAHCELNQLPLSLIVRDIFLKNQEQ